MDDLWLTVQVLAYHLLSVFIVSPSLILLGLIPVSVTACIANYGGMLSTPLRAILLSTLVSTFAYLVVLVAYDGWRPFTLMAITFVVPVYLTACSGLFWLWRQIRARAPN